MSLRRNSHLNSATSKLAPVIFGGLMLLGCTAEESNDENGIGSTSLRTNWDRFGPLLDDETRLLISSEIVAEENLRERLEGLVDPARAHRYPFQATNWCDYLRVRDEHNARKIRLDIDLSLIHI